jgi:4'-phosphopantetheinyl transferase EntD
MIEALLPNETACVAVRGEIEAELFPAEAAQIHGAVEARVREFVTGRACARLALCKLHLPITPVLRGAAREPVWPTGVVGSITHCTGYRAAAAARQADMAAIGIDAEVHEALPKGVLEQVAVEEERRWLVTAPAGVHWDRVLFSAKESVFKAWFPLSGRWLGFDDAVVTFQPSMGTFHAVLLVPSPENLHFDLTGFTGRFLVRGGLVLTAIVVPAIGLDTRAGLPHI